MRYRWECTHCNILVEVSRPVSDCTRGPGPEDDAVCLCETPDWRRVYEAPMQLRASFPDGHRRSGWQDLKESARLEKIAAVSKSDTKAEIRKEISKMGIKPGRSV